LRRGDLRRGEDQERGQGEITMLSHLGQASSRKVPRIRLSLFALVLSGKSRNVDDGSARGRDG
jgi:hypothetical protein